MKENEIKNAPFPWSTKSERAALLASQDKLTDAEIVTEVGIAPVTLWRWKHHPDFQARIESLVDAYRASIRRRGIAIVENRVDALQDRWDKMKTVIAERATDPEVQNVPGGKTGLITKTLKGVGKGEDFQLVEVYEVDTGLLKALLEHEQQAAKELGQWTDKTQITGVVKGYIGIELEDV